MVYDFPVPGGPWIRIILEADDLLLIAAMLFKTAVTCPEFKS